MAYAHRMENVFAMRISPGLIAEKNGALMTVVEMEYAIAIKNACAKMDLAGRIVLPLLAKIIAEEYFKEFALKASAIVEMDFLENPADLKPARIVALIMENASKGFVNANLDLKARIVRLKFVLIIALDMGFVQVRLFINVLVMMDLLEKIAL